MELLERETHLAELSAALNESQRGQGRLALVSGEAGIGKTALVERFTRRRERSVGLYWGACDALFTPIPLGPLHDMAPRAGADLQSALSSGAPPGTIFSAVLLELQRHPSIAVFEDIHWADEATLDLLRYLGRRIRQTSALLVLTYRDDELSPRHPLHTLLGDLLRLPTARRIALPPLSAGAVRELVGEQAIDAVALHSQTGGNPFFVSEVLANPGSSVPVTVRDAVLARVARLSTSGYAVLEACAVIGRRVKPWLLNQVVSAEAPSVDESIAAGMLFSQEGEMVFRHELARQAMLETISPPRLKVLHRLVLEALETSAYATQDYARLTHHAEAAGDRPAILLHAPAAARQASHTGAHRAALALYELSLEYAEGLPPADHAALLEEYSVECDVLDRRPTAIQARRQAAEFWRLAGNTLRYGDSLGKLALLLHLVGEGEQAARVNETAIQALEALPPNRELAIVYNSQAILHLARMENQRGVELAARAIELVNHLQATELLPRLYETLGLCWLHLDHEKGIELLERSHTLGIEFGQSMRVANSYANLSSVYVEFFRLERAEQFIPEGMGFVTERDLEFARMYILAWQAQLDLLHGRWTQAAASAGTVVNSAKTSIGSRSPALMVLGRLHARQGEPEAEAALAEALELLFKLGFRQREGMLRGALAEAAYLSGDTHKALAEAEQVYEQAIRQRHPWVAGELAYWRWRCGASVETYDWMAAPYKLEIAGDFQAAALAWEALGCPYEQARALANGEAEMQVKALEIFERLGARPDARRLRAALQENLNAGVPRRPHTSTRENPFGLTNRQVEILALLVEGLSNAEIAARLYISAKTVDHHVSAVLSKLDVQTRQEAASIARQHPHFTPKI